MPEQTMNCSFCGHSHAPTLSARVVYRQPGREGLPTYVGHTPCNACGGYHESDDDHEQCNTCGDIHPDPRPHLPSPSGLVFGENPQHGPNRYCEGCDEYTEADHADNWEEEHYGPPGYRRGDAPRDEDALVHQEPTRVAGINDRINKLVAVHDKRVSDSPYFIKHSPRGTYYGQDFHNVQVYHKSDPNTRVGYLSYDDHGEVGGMYIDHRHQGTMAATQMLVAAHRHLKDTIGNPIGLLRTGNTSEHSAALIRKIDPDSTYLRHEDANSGRDTSYQDEQYRISNVPVRNDTLERPVSEWEELSKKSGQSVYSLMAMSYDPHNRGLARSNYDVQKTKSPFFNHNHYAESIGNTIEEGQREAEVQTQKDRDARLARDSADLLANRVHHVAGDMPANHPIENAWVTPAYMAQNEDKRDFTELQRRYPETAAILLAQPNLESIYRTSQNVNPITSSKRQRMGVGRVSPEGIKANLELGADVIGTSGVWTGDEAIDAKSTVTPKPTLPLDLNPFERVKRIVGRPSLQSPETNLYIKDE